MRLEARDKITYCRDRNPWTICEGEGVHFISGVNLSDYTFGAGCFQDSLNRPKIGVHRAYS